MGLMGGEDFETDNPCDVLKLEELKAKVCFVSEDIDKDNAKMGERGPRRRKARRAVNQPERREAVGGGLA